MKKFMVGFIGLLLSVSVVFAETKGTAISHFILDTDQVKGKIKTFVNNSKHDLVFRWKVRDLKTGKTYIQEPIVKKGASTILDFGVVAKQFAQDGINPEQYEFSLEILKVIRYSKAPGEELKIRGLKDGEFVSLINKNKFLKHTTFTLSRNKNGLLVVQST